MIDEKERGLDGYLYKGGRDREPEETEGLKD